MDRLTLTQNAARAEKANAGHDLRCDPGRIHAPSGKWKQAKAREEAGTGRHQARGPESGRRTANLAIDAKQQTEDESDEDTEREVELAVERRLLTPAGTSSGRRAAGFILRTRLVR